MASGIRLASPSAPAAPRPTPSVETRAPRVTTFWLAVTLAGGVTVVALAAYFLTLAPTITWRHAAADSGELAAAAYVFGVPHPTGYPLWLVLATVVARLGPATAVAWRLNLFSATTAALAAGALALVTMQTGDRLFAPPGALAPSGSFTTPGVCPATDVASRGTRRGGELIDEPPFRSDLRRQPSRQALLAGAVAGVALAASTGVWNIAVVTETYALHLLLVSLLLASALLGAGIRWRALLASLALANHVTALPMAAMAILLDRSAVRARAAAVPWFLPGPLLYLLLPLRALGHPASDWGSPTSPAAFLALVTGRDYRYLLVLPSPVEGLQRLAAALHFLVTQFAWPFWPLAILGLPILWRDRQTRLWLLVGGGYLLFPVVYRAAGVEHYLLPALAMLALAAAAGGYRVAILAARWPAPARASGAAALAVAGLTALLIGARVSSLRGDTTALTWAQLALQNARARSTLLTADDDRTFALWYVQRVEGLRPDVVVVDQRLWSQSWYRAQLDATR